MDNFRIVVNEKEANSDNSETNNQIITPKKSILDQISFFVLMAVVFLMPLFFLPISGIPLEFSKVVLLSVGVFISLMLWLFARLKDGVLVIPKISFLIFYISIPLVFLISALFSPAIQMSMVGIGSEIGTVFSMLVLFILAFLSSVFFQSNKKILGLYIAFALSIVIIALFQIIRLIGGPDVLSFGMFTSPLSNLIGKWNDLAIFSGFISVLSLITIGFLNLKKSFKILSYIALITSVLLMILVNFKEVWIIVGLFALIIFVYNLFFGDKKVSIPPLVVVVISVVLFFSGNFVDRLLFSALNLSQIEARPTWISTTNIAKNTLSENPILGSGPNRFSSEWLLYKPENVNQTIFWNTDFNFGVGIVPSFAITTGIAGLILWILFLGFFVFAGIKAIFSVRSDKKIHYLSLSSFLGALYLWIVAVFYTPNITVFALAFLMTGVFSASLIELGLIKNLKISFSNNPKKSFVSVLVIILFIIISIVGIYISLQKFTSAVSFQESRILIAGGNLEQSKIKMERAVKSGGSDLYYRSLSDINLLELNVLISQNISSLDKVQAEFQNILGNAINNARIATEKDSEGYQNWISLARVYESVVPLQIQGAYENAKASYLKSLEFNPKSPAIYLSLARLELISGNTDEAKLNIAKAIDLKNNYTDAIFLSSRISADEGNLVEAIEKAEIASLISPNDVGLFFHLGFLRYSNDDFQESIIALERAVLLRPDYANAHYFLGLSYDKVDRTEDAISEFEQVESTNQDNLEVKKILNNLRNSKDPFSNAEVVSPKERDVPPIEEDI